MAITTGNEATKRPVLAVSIGTIDSDGANLLYITDLTFTGNNNVAVYNTIDSLDSLKFATTSDRTMELSFLRDNRVQANVEQYFNNKAEVNWKLSPLGTTAGSPYKSGKGYITKLDEKKSGTGIWEISATLDVNGAVSAGTH
jgi:hypothetical protein